MKSIKQAAKTLKSTLESMGYKIPMGHSLDLIAKLQGTKDWNALSAILKMNADVAEAPKEEVVPEWDKSAPMSDAQYVAKMGCHCPSCGSEDIEGSEIEVDASIAWQEMVCSGCGAEWNDNYVLVGYGEFEAGSDTDDDGDEDGLLVLIIVDQATGGESFDCASASERDALFAKLRKTLSIKTDGVERKVYFDTVDSLGNSTGMERLVAVFDGKAPETKPDEKDIGHVSAEAHSDDRAVEVAFNAASWLASASEKKIVALACCEWGGDYAADRVVHDLIFDGKSPLSDDLNEILKHGGHMTRINKTVGFECTVDEDEAMQWLRAHRRSLWTAIKTLDVLEGVGIDVDEDGDQPGLWLWTAPTDSCEMSLPSFSEAALDAWQGLVATTMGANNLSTEQWEALSFDQQLSQVYDCCANA